MSVDIRQIGEILYLLENGLPYPTSAYSTSVPRFLLDGVYQAEPENHSARETELPFCFNKIGDELEDFEGEVTFTKSFVFPKTSAAFHRLVIDNFHHSVRLWLNGQYLGDSSEPNLPAIFNAGAALVQGGENHIKIVLSNCWDSRSLPPRQFKNHKPGWKLYAGIFGDIYIESLPDTACFKADIRTNDNAVCATLLFQTTCASPEASLELTAPDGTHICREDFRLQAADGFACHVFRQTLSSPLQWSPEHPALYCMTVFCGADKWVYRFGFRKIEARAEGILLNGKPFFLRGICRHEETHKTGRIMSNDDIEIETGLVQELGCNFVRLAHYPHSERAYTIADERGLGLWTEVANYQAGLGIIQGLFGKSSEIKSANKKSLRFIFNLLKSRNQLLDAGYLLRVRTSLLKLVELRRNHPSILFWGIGNECWSFSQKAGRVLAGIRNEMLRFDNSRPVCYAAFSLPLITRLFERSFGVMDAICANEYFGWYYGKAGSAKGFWGGLHIKYPQKSMLLTETGADSFIDDQDSQTNQCSMLTSHIQTAHETKGMSGYCIWLLKDFACPEYPKTAPTNGENCKGLLTSDLQKKKAFFEVQKLQLHRYKET